MTDEYGADRLTGMVVRPADYIADEDQTPDSWCCIDCGANTAPGFPNKAALLAGIARGCLSLFTPEQEVYTVTAKVWREAGDPEGCLCIGCLEVRLGRYLRPKDFAPGDGLNGLPCSARLRDRRGF